MIPTRRAGIDVGGTKCLGVVLDEHDRVVVEQYVHTPKGADAVIDTVVELALSLGDVDTLGVGVPGLVTRSGVLRAAPNLFDVQELDVGGLVSGRLGRHVEIDNDATCAAAAEWRIGAGRGLDDFVMATLGTGIGGGVVAAGRLVRGANGFCGEIGHMVVDPSGPRCPCGGHGCWERYASGSGLGWLGRRAAEAGRLRDVLAAVGGDPGAVRGEHLTQAALHGDSDAMVVIDEFARWVALGLANITNLLDPKAFVLGGGLAAAPDLFLPPIRQWFDHLLYSPDLRPHPALLFAELGPRAGAVGAALLADVH
jgi:glucokinase